MKRVRERAYQLWEAAGCGHGHDMEHWLMAESQIAAEQATAQSKSPQHTSTSAPTSPAETPQKSSRDRGKAAAKEKMENKEIPTVAASPIPRKTRSKK